jgi:3-oxoacyl-(acyl-carrier-protein) synthase
VNYINAHATSTPAGDLKEYQALIHCFGQNPEVTWMHNVCPFSKSYDSSLAKSEEYTASNNTILQILDEITIF